MRIEIDQQDIAAAADAGFIEPARVEVLYAFLLARVAQDGHVRISPSTGGAVHQGRSGPVGRLGLVHVLWFAGALLVLGAMTFFATLGFDAFGGVGLAVIAGVYGAVFTLVGLKLWRDPSLKVFGGLCVTLAVGMVPLFTFGIERATGLWPGVDPGSYRGFTEWVKGGWLGMEVATVVAGVVALRVVRFPFLVTVPSVALWFMSMDVCGLLFEAPDAHARGWVSTAFGAAMLGVGFLLRRRGVGDLAFWLDTFGLVAFQGGLLSQRSDDLLPKAAFLLVQMGLLEAGRRLSRSFFLLVACVGLLSVQGALMRNSTPVLFCLGCALGLLVYGYAARRAGPSSASLVAFLAAAVFALVLPWGALDDDALGRVIYALVASVLVLVAVPARSRALVATGGLGLTVLLGDLAFSVFKDSLVFPLVVASLGIGVMVLGYLIQKNSQRIDDRLDAMLPPFVKELRVPR